MTMNATEKICNIMHAKFNMYRVIQLCYHVSMEISCANIIYKLKKLMEKTTHLGSYSLVIMLYVIIITLKLYSAVKALNLNLIVSLKNKFKINL